MSGLFGGGGNSVSNEAERLATVQIQTSTYGATLALVYGTGRTAANLVYYEQRDFKAIPHTDTQKVGKGGGGSTISNTTYTYSVPAVLAICAGPIVGVQRVWRDKEVGSVAGFGLTLALGQPSQAPWAWAVGARPDRAVSYAGVAYVANAAFDLGSTATLKNHSFEVQGFCLITSGPGLGDAHPADIVTHFLTDPTEGVGWASNRLDVTTYRTYCTAAGFFMSPVIADQKQAAMHLQDLLDATNTGAVWTDGGAGRMVVKLIPFGDTAITANGVTYTPNTTPVYDLGPDDFLPMGDDAVEVEILSLAEAYNIVPVEFTNRSLDYNLDVRSDPALEDVHAYGERKAETWSLHCITRESHALAISGIKARRNVSCRVRYKFRLGWRFVRLDPMDLVTLTDPVLGLDHKVVRIREIEEDDEGTLTVTAEEWPFGVASPTLYTTQTNDGAVPNVNADPGAAAAPVIMAVPALMWSGDDPELWLVTSGGSLWGGCDVYVSTDAGASYTKVGSVTAPGKHGTLTAPLVAAPGVDDQTSTLSIQLAQTSQQLQGTTAQGAQDLLTQCWVGGEILSYQTATLTGAGAYNLTKLRRGAYGSDMNAKLAGAQFARLDGAVCKVPMPASRVGQALKIKLCSFNIWGGGLQDLSTVTAYSYTPAGYALPAPSAVNMAVSTTKPA